MPWLGLDIGGVNLKAADGRGWARSRTFPLWREPDRLADALAELLRDAPHAEKLAVTMTGELCDCFATKAAGVRHILSAAQRVAAGRGVRVYLADGRFASLDQARELPHLAAASNWHALASFACRYAQDGPSNAALLVDVGSTTTDVVPLVDGRVAARGRGDLERLASGELVYSGVGRTPVCAVTSHLPWCGRPCPIAAEVFATTADAYLLLNELEVDEQADWTADGRPLTSPCARQRLARMLCADAANLRDEDFQEMASAIREAQIAQVERAVTSVIGQMPHLPSQFVISGTGEFLAQAVLNRSSLGTKIVSLAEVLGSGASRGGPAYALAVLARESGAS